MFNSIVLNRILLDFTLIKLSVEIHPLYLTENILYRPLCVNSVEAMGDKEKHVYNYSNIAEPFCCCSVCLLMSRLVSHITPSPSSVGGVHGGVVAVVEG